MTDGTGHGAAGGPAHRPVMPLPSNALVVLIGASGSGKSTWARRWFRSTQVVSSDRCRALVSDDETDQRVNREAFAVFYEIVRSRLNLGRLTVADSTALTPHPRERLRDMAAAAGVPAVAVVVAAPLEVLFRNNRRRRRNVPEPVLERHAQMLSDLLDSGDLEREGYLAVHLIRFPVFAEPRIGEPLIIGADRLAPDASASRPDAP